jgi:hypothetical protein
MDFEEFCAATISPYQLEALPRWEEIASTAFKYFEQEGNHAFKIEELAQVCRRNTLSTKETFDLLCMLIYLLPLTYRR